MSGVDSVTFVKQFCKGLAGRRRVLSGLFLLMPIAGCRSHAPGEPKLVPHVVLRDVSFHSAALQRDVQYRVYLPDGAGSVRLPSVYLLHGAGTDFRDWSVSSNVQALAAAGYVLIMPDGGNAYDVNSATVPRDRYEDFLATDLIADVEDRFPVAHDASRRAILGVSMGGFGALTQGIKHPDHFAFAGAMSPPLDAPQRRFAWTRFGQSLRLRRIFGPAGSEESKARDPFVLLRTADTKSLPFLYLSCGLNEGLLPVNRRFAQQLAVRQVPMQFDTPPGGHSWSQWNAELPSVLRSLQQHVR